MRLLFWFPVWIVLGCSPATNRVIARTVLDFSDALCVVAKADLEVPVILQACQINSDLGPAVRDLVAAHRAAASRERTGCSRDGGP